MAHEPAWGPRRPVSDARAKGATSSVACFLFVAAMGAAFWIGAIWASQSWFALSR